MAGMNIKEFPPVAFNFREDAMLKVKELVEAGASRFRSEMGRSCGSRGIRDARRLDAA